MSLEFAEKLDQTKSCDLKRALNRFGIEFDLDNNINNNNEEENLRLNLKTIPKVFFTKYIKDMREIEWRLKKLIESLINVIR